MLLRGNLQSSIRLQIHTGHNHFEHLTSLKSTAAMLPNYHSHSDVQKRTSPTCFVHIPQAAWGELQQWTSLIIAILAETSLSSIGRLKSFDTAKVDQLLAKSFQDGSQDPSCSASRERASLDRTKEINQTYSWPDLQCQRQRVHPAAGQKCLPKTSQHQQSFREVSSSRTPTPNCETPHSTKQVSLCSARHRNWHSTSCRCLASQSSDIALRTN